MSVLYWIHVLVGLDSYAGVNVFIQCGSVCVRVSLNNWWQCGQTLNTLISLLPNDVIAGCPHNHTGSHADIYTSFKAHHTLPILFVCHCMFLIV